MQIYRQSEPEVRLKTKQNQNCTVLLAIRNSRLLTNASVTASPFCAWPMRRSAIATPFLVKNPLFSLSAMDHISPKTAGGSLDPAKTLTATSPVIIPSSRGSAEIKTWLTSPSSAVVGLKVDIIVGCLPSQTASSCLGLRVRKITQFP